MKTKRTYCRAIAISTFLSGMLCFSLTSAWSQKLLPDVSPRLWYGELDVGERLFRFLIKATQNNNGSWAAELESIDEGRSKFALSNFGLTANSLAFELKASGASYQGSLDPESGDINGKWTQSGTDFDLSFSSVEEVPSNQPDEIWVGQINAFLQKVDVQIRVYQDDSGHRAIFFDSVSQKAGGFKATMSVDQDQVAIDVPMVGGTFKGTLNEAGDQIVGKWTQGIALDLTLAKSKNAVEATPSPPPARPQTPRPPFPYQVEQVQFENTASNITLQGTLTKPHADNDSIKFPAAILITGSGPQDRDETIFGHKPFLVIADHLTRHGIAVLRYDERGVGQSTGNFESATTADFARDVVFAIEFLKQRADIDSSQIGLIGHSEGGIVASIVAAESNDVAWIVLLAGTGVNGREIVYSQSRLIAAVEGATPAMLDRQQVKLDVIFEWLPQLKVGQLNETDSEKIVSEITSRILQNETGQSLDQQQEPIDTPTSQQQLATEVEAMLRSMNNPWFRYFIAFEPGSVLIKVACPVLALNGERDLQVDPELNLPKIVEHLQSGKNPPHQVVVFPELNHLFQTCQTGSPTEYENIEETFSITVLETMQDWIRHQAVKGNRTSQD